MNNNINDFRKLDKSKLNSKLQELRKSLNEKRIENAGSKDKNTNQSKYLRKEIARALTVINEKETLNEQ